MEAVHAVQKAIDYMDEQLDTHLELEQIAAIAYMSVPSLYRVFYALTGHPLKEYIRKRRTSQAALLLRQTDGSMLDIALECGFDSYQTFTKSFKKITGLTPGAYRKASLYYSFERINLLEKFSYSEKKELSEQYPDVKVLRLGEMKAIVYNHCSIEKENLEKTAFGIFYATLSVAGFPVQLSRVFGRNVESDGHNEVFQYRLMAAFTDAIPGEYPDLQVETFSGGLYAVSMTMALEESAIVQAWNRLLSEWLPRSTFTLGDHSFLEEYEHYKGKLTKLKLCLPVKRKTAQENILLVKLDTEQVIAFRANGENSQTIADERVTDYLRETGASSGMTMFMSYSYGVSSGEDYWYELAVTQQAELHANTPNSGVMKHIEGGWYASLTTSAYGVMTGVVDLLYNWLLQNEEFSQDLNRQWFAKYVPGKGPDLDRTTSVICYVPVIRN